MEVLETKRVLDSTVVFNEVMYHPLEGDTMEFIELYNQMGVDMDLSGWRVDGGIDYQFPEGTVLASDAFFVLAADPGALALVGVQADGQYTGRLANSGETLELLDRNDRRMDRLEYQDAGDWPIEADGSGASMAKRLRQSTSGPAEHWVSSGVHGGTPGRANFADQILNLPEPRDQTLVPWQSEWRHSDSTTAVSANWNLASFDDGVWRQAVGVSYAGRAHRADSNTRVISEVTADASSQLAGHDPSQMIDGSGLNGNTHTSSNAVDTMWQSTGTFFGLTPDTDPEVTFDLGAEQSVDAMRVWNFNFVDSDTCCTNRGIARADILVAGDDGIFTPLLIGQEFDAAPGTDTDFSQVIDLAGVIARFIKLDVDTSNGVANHGDPFSFVGLSEVQFLSRPPAGDTELALGAETYYFRHEFQFDDAPERTDLFLETLIDDGAVVYLNGTEIYRQNLPEGLLTSATPAVFSVPDASLQQVSLPGAALVPGNNVLAVEVHQSDEANDPDMVFGLELKSTTYPPSELGPELPLLSINEVGSDEAGLFVELYNSSNTSIDITSYELRFSNGTNQPLVAGSIGAGERRVIRTSGEAWTIGDGDRIYLRDTAQRTVVSAAHLDQTAVTMGAMARIPEGTGRFQVTTTATPGLANSADIEDAIVINEIMYHYRPTVAVPETPPTLEDIEELVAFGSEWRYNESGELLPNDWAQSPHQVGGNWQTGAGLLGYESSELPSPGIVTQFEDPRSNSIITYYAETDFELTAEEIASTDAIGLQHIVDDGAAFFLNGVEIARFNLENGIDPTTVASASVSNAQLSERIDVPMEHLVPGTNRLSVQVHQRNGTSNDVVLGAKLVRSRKLDSGTEAVPYSENSEEWVELYNRGTESVDLSGWQLSSAIEATIPNGLRLGPGEYLVVANDVEQLSAKHPEVADRIIGNFRGSLSNSSETLRLHDALGNVTDEVKYVEGGQWPAAADGGGSSLELRDPWADNANPLAWSASDESINSPWTTYTYQGVASRSQVGPDGVWEEFLIGMLSDGEILLDDVSIIEDPSGAARELIQNGTFDSDAVGEHADKWRLIGNHRHSEVIVDPNDASNQVLRFVATGATEHMHNHGETTLKSGDEFVDIRNGQEYKISFRAKWISGGNLFNTRLYFNRLPRTTPIQQPDRHGTPGSANTAQQAGDNIGPTFENAKHLPTIPDPGEPVVVSINADDPQGIDSLKLWYSIESGAWTSVEMQATGGSGYRGTIPGSDARDVVQFFVEGTDALGAISTWPRDGRDSRALYQVEDGRAADTGLRNFRIVMTPDDASLLHSEVELMSNDRVGTTIIVNESEVYYDAGVRLSGSQRARPNPARLSFSVGFNSDQLYRGVHGAITIDRSESTGFGQREHLYHHGMNHAGGGLPSEYNDLFHVIAPLNQHTGGAEAQLARYSDIYFDEQFEDGADGQLYEYELVYYPTTTDEPGNRESRKVPEPDSVVGANIAGFSGSKEDFRWTFLNKNNRLEDDFSRLQEFTEAWGFRTTEFLEQIHEYIDVDQWLRTFAFAHITGHGDNYTSDGAQHNLQLYIRPSDQRVLQMPHDLDAFFSVTNPLVNNSDLRRLIRNPEYEHMYYGHVLDMIDTTFNTEYMERWTNYWRSLLPAQRFDRHLSEMQARSDYLTDRILRVSEPTEFSITTAPIETDAVQVELAGNGWFNVREIRLSGSDSPLAVTWTDTTTWEATVPVQAGAQTLVLEAIDFQGNVLSSDSLMVTSSSANLVDTSLHVSEVHYNPGNPTAAELRVDSSLEDGDFEFIEFVNTGTMPINLLGVYFSDAIEFTFPSFELAAGATVVVARTPAAFKLRYADVATDPLGPYSGKLDNGGERLAINNANGETIIEFTYDDDAPWPASADGDGDSLQNVSPGTALPELAASWIAALPSPNSVQTRSADLNEDGEINAADIDRLCAAINGGESAFDLNQDGELNSLDRDRLLAMMGVPIGDSNLDGIFNSSDLVDILIAGEYEDAIDGNSGWSEGDWNCDGDFNTQDFVAALELGTYRRD